jgi:predicted ArsR family transcriptional regulator
MVNRANGLTRQSILSEIKQRGSVTTDELGEDLGISSVAVRQHLSTLAAEGRVSITIERRGLGRPVHRYHLTPEGDEEFDRSYDDLCIQLLDSVRDTQGNDGVDAIMASRTKKLTAGLMPRVTGVPLETRVREIARFQDGFGYMASSKAEDGSVKLTEYNCAICKVAKEFPNLCNHEMEMFQELAGTDVSVVRESHILSGDIACVYRFTPKA